MVAPLNPSEFDEFVERTFGPEAVEDNYDDGYDPASVPKSIFRVMSDEHYQQSAASGMHVSDERNNWRAQAKQEGRSTDGIPAEGTVGGRWVEPGYLPTSAPGRIVQFDASQHDGWEVHPDVPEGDYIRSMSPIPMRSATKVSPPIRYNPNVWSTGRFTIPRA